MFQAPLFLLSLWRNRNKVFIGIGLVAFLAAGAYIAWLRHDLTSTKDKLTTAENTVKEKQAQLDDLQIRANAALAELTVINKKQADRLKNARLREREIRNVSKDQDGPIAPVMRDSLERMRDPSKN